MAYHRMVFHKQVQSLLTPTRVATGTPNSARIWNGTRLRRTLYRLYYLRYRFTRQVPLNKALCPSLTGTQGRMRASLLKYLCVVRSDGTKRRDPVNT
jgi:hypothetical protein